MSHRKHGGQQHPGEVGGDHHAGAWEAVDEAAGDRREQQNGGDLGEDGTRPPSPEPVRATRSSARVVNCATSPTWLTVRASHSRR